jgi:2-polyprenyl-3-methyl-5-hydroxy-6-metoxy-1,4-benzoquinol methylase
MEFRWNELQRKEDGKLLLLWRHQRVLEEDFFSQVKSVLDVGGEGFLALACVEEGKQVEVLNLLEAKDYGMQDRTEFSWRVDNILDPKEQLSCYDLITCCEMLEHAKDAELALKQMASLLTENGWLVGTVPIPGAVHAVDDPEVVFLEPKKMKALLKKAGLQKIEIEETPSVNKTDTKMCSYYFKAQKGTSKKKVKE